MNLDELLQSISRLFLDTAPVIYYVERHPNYFVCLEPLFQRIDAGSVIAVTSPVTLAECLVMPFRLNLLPLQQNFSDLIVMGRNTEFHSLNADIGQRAAELRARYNLTLTDAFQIATALHANCEAFLTNDIALQRVTELRVLTVDELN